MHAPAVFLGSGRLAKTGYGYSQFEHWQAVGQSLSVETSSSTQPGAKSGTVSLHLKPAGIVYAAIIYLLSMFLATFFYVAFYHEILTALKGGSVSVSRGMAFACTKWRPILTWTLFAGLAGLIIRTVEEKLEVVGNGSWV